MMGRYRANAMPYRNIFTQVSVLRTVGVEAAAEYLL